MTSTNKDGQSPALSPPLVRLSGLQRLCKLFGRMKCGATMMSWDYVNNVALPEAELLKDKPRWAASERAKYGVLPNTQAEERRDGL